MGRIADTTVAVHRAYHGIPGHQRLKVTIGVGPVPPMDVADRRRREVLARARQPRPFDRTPLPPRWVRRLASVPDAAKKRHAERRPFRGRGA